LTAIGVGYLEIEVSLVLPGDHELNQPRTGATALIDESVAIVVAGV
jgi:hypothetical protein